MEEGRSRGKVELGRGAEEATGVTKKKKPKPGCSHDGWLMFHNWLPKNNTHTHAGPDM